MHAERALNDGELFVHHLSELEIQTGDLVVGEMRGESHIDSATAISGVPLRVVINALSTHANGRNEGGSLLKGGELE